MNEQKPIHLTPLEKYVAKNPHTDFEVIARDLNRTVSTIERACDRLHKKTQGMTQEQINALVNPLAVVIGPNPKCEYQNDGTRITAPGKFEGEPVFAPYYWNLGLEGFADSDENGVFKFSFTRAEITSLEFGEQLFNWLGRKRTLCLQEDSQGFVRCF